MDFRGGKRENLRRIGLPEVNTRSVHSRGAKRAVTAESGGSGFIFRAVTATARDSGHTAVGRRGGSGGDRTAVGDRWWSSR